MKFLLEIAQVIEHMEILSLREIRAKLDSKEISVHELVQQYLKRINETNSTLNSFITVDTEHVGDRIDHAQKEIDAGNQSALTGIPYGVKDLFCTKGLRTTAGSKILSSYIPPYSATAVEKLRDAVLMGKTNCDEFALGSSNEYSAYGPVRNPYDLERVPGGTSGGSAAAVASGQVPFAYGTDTGGSIRLPAAFCNVIGFKPTYGRISRYGVIPAASSFDTVGFITRTVEDAAVLLQEVAGVDPLDSTTPDVPVDEYVKHCDKKIGGLKVGVPKDFIELEGLDPRIKASYETTLKMLSALGATMIDVSLPHAEFGLAAYYILNPSEVSSNLARYDGIQFGKPSAQAKNLEEVFTKTREQGFGPEAKRRIMVGTFCLSAGYIDAYYKKAMRVRTLIKEDFSEAFRQVDIMLIPTAPIVPFKIGERDKDPLSMYAADIYTVPISLAGVPALSLPSGFVDGLPVAVQIVAPQFHERVLLKAADALEQELSLKSPQLAI